ncbi:hypothetical protein HMN09_00549200 [Mycena chlorophos]|uniref:Uncharacterized protein n=1 Tax=Mycena chlorophos TaxID=658473 RepID=A0A8H6TAK9_MYCCL|nr:hypothetical protein HMN09_00549200 [Mycena chlorophos]
MGEPRVVELHIQIHYRRNPEDDADLSRPASREEGIKTLRAHLGQLKIPQPKATTVKFLPGVGVTFFWEIKQDSVLHKAIASKLESGMAGKEDVVAACSIERMEMKVISKADGELLPELGRSFSFALPSTRTAPPPPLPLPPPPPVAPERDAMQSGPSTRSGSVPLLNVPGLPVSSSSSREIPVDALRTASTSANGHRPSSSAPNELSTREPHHPNSRAAALVVPTVASPNKGSIASSIASSRHSSPRLAAPVPVPVEDTTTRILANGSLVQEPTEEDAMENQGAPMEDEMDISRSPSPIPGLSAGSSRTSTELAEQLACELLDIRREIAVNLTKERAIIAALSDMASGTYTPHSIPHTEQAELAVDERIFIEQIRLDFLNRELERLRDSRGEVEDAIKAVAREKRPPFVSPALLDVFVGVSRLSTQALEASGC